MKTSIKSSVCLAVVCLIAVFFCFFLKNDIPAPGASEYQDSQKSSHSDLKREDGGASVLLGEDSAAQRDELNIEDDPSWASEFRDVDELLANLNDPRVQDYIKTLPPESQQYLFVESLKRSVSQRIGQVMESGYHQIDMEQLFRDIDTLENNKALLPGEAEFMKQSLNAPKGKS